MLKGIGASQGFGIGKAVVIKDINLDYSFVKFIYINQLPLEMNNTNSIKGPCLFYKSINIYIYL